MGAAVKADFGELRKRHADLNAEIAFLEAEFNDANTNGVVRRRLARAQSISHALSKKYQKASCHVHNERKSRAATTRANHTK